MSFPAERADFPALTRPVASGILYRLPWQPALVFGLFVVLALACQRSSGAVGAGFGGAADEAAHFVTSLMIRDYVAQGIPSDPVSYAERYYVHYPKVAFGIWPPLFHLVGAGWLLLFGASTASGMTFVAVIGAFLALVVYHLGARLIDRPTGLVAAAWFLVLPVVRLNVSMFMMDMLCATFMLLATIALGRSLDREQPRDSYLFGVFAAAAAMTKYNALALALVPLLAVGVARKYDALRRLRFWSPALIVAVLCGWWYIAKADLVWYASQPYATSTAIPATALRNARMLATMLGWPLLPLVCIGFVVTLAPSARRENRGIWAALFSLIVAVWLFHSVLYPIADRRYLIPAMPALLLFGCAGAHSVVSRVFKQTQLAAVVLLAGVTCVTWAIPGWQKHNRGFEEMARAVAANGLKADSPVLICSDAEGEGAFVAAVALLEQRPTSIVLRASKFLASSTWMQEDYRTLHPGTTELMNALDEARVSQIVIDEFQSAPAPPHRRALLDAIRSSQQWRQTAVHREHGAGLTLFERVNALSPAPPRIRIDMSYSLGKSLVY